MIILLTVIHATGGDIGTGVGEIQFNLTTIKFPQLVGIIAGLMVFLITISVVFYLLYASGSLSKLVEEIKAEQTGKNAVEGSALGKDKATIAPQYTHQPELYDNLILASKMLPIKPKFDILIGESIVLQSFEYEDREDETLASLLEACDGRAIFGESDYDPARIWGWLGVPPPASFPNTANSESLWPSDSIERFKSTFSSKAAVPEGVNNECHIAILDKELHRPIGMISLKDNQPHHLSIKIANMWITPAYQGKAHAKETILLILEWLNKSGYRRITAEVDERHTIARKFLERCGFLLEAVLRKHRILQNRNSNTALYVSLNSEWFDVEKKLKTALGISLQAKTHKIAEIDEPLKPFASPARASNRIAVGGNNMTVRDMSGSGQKKKAVKRKKSTKP